MYKLSSLQDIEVDPNLPLFCDTETCGFYGKIRLLQMMQKGWEEVILVEWPDPYLVAAFIDKYDTRWYNAHYDITVVQQQTSTRWIPKNFDCLFLLSRLAYPAEYAFALDDVLVYLLGYDPYSRAKLDKKALQKSKWDSLKLTEDQYMYATIDVLHMPELFDRVQEQLDTPSYKLDKSTLMSCLDFQWEGMPVLQDAIHDKYAANLTRINELNCPVNVNSWQQVRPYIGEEESDDLALAKFAAQGNTKAAIVREARKLRKQNSFLDKFDTVEGRIHGKFKPTARSGRLTSDDQNLQQIPRDLKSVFGYEPSAGRILVYSDYAQLELRTICAIVNCVAMAELFISGEDLHGYTAAMVFGSDWTATHRQISKTYNFNLLYGGGINMILAILLKQVGIQQSEKDAYSARKKWRNLWKELYAWQERGISAWKKGKLHRTPLGRWYKGKLMTDHLNIENQGAGAEVAKLALHYINERGLPRDVQLINFIHDSFILDCPDEPGVYEEAAKIVAECMQEAWFEMSKLFKVKDLPMPVKVNVGYNWGELESDVYKWKYDLEPYAMLEKVNAAV
jgi:hypothetical protein